MDSTYEDVARRARKHPNVWMVLRSGVSNANLVTRIRQGKVETFPRDEFSARSVRYSNDDGSVGYTIEVRCDAAFDLPNPNRAMKHDLVAALRSSSPIFSVMTPSAISDIERALYGVVDRYIEREETV